MIRRLRIRFIVVSMISLLLVLGIILGIAAVVNFRSIASDADSVLELLSSNEGKLPEPREEMDWKAVGTRYKSPELPYEIRYFSALTDENGGILSTDSDRIVAVSEDEIAEYAKQVGQRTSGYIGDYRFLRYEDDEGIHYLFLDCGRMLAAKRHDLLTEIWISLVGMAAVMLLITLLSSRVIKPLAESYDKQRRFITDAGHELKTPITVIDADAALLEMELGENEWLSDIQMQTAKLTRLTGELIDLSRMEESQRAEMILFSMSDVVKEIVEGFSAPIRAQEHTLKLFVMPLISVVGDQRAITRLISILMDNAVKYVGGAGEITVSLEKVGKNVRLTVENDTDGVEKATLDNMFERFYRADSARNSDGYGIGLSIAKAIVAAHRGKIAASAKDGKRMVITVTLPQ